MRVVTSLAATIALTAAAAVGAQTVYSNAPPGYQRGDRYDARQTIVCGSDNMRYNRCDLPWRGDARLVQQLSSSACVRGQTWGIRRGSLWVNQGCRGRFAPAGYAGGGGGWQPGPDWNRQIALDCGSGQYQYGFCQVDVGRHGRVSLRRQLSRSACVEGQSWGWNRAGIWTDHGCTGSFLVDRRW